MADSGARGAVDAMLHELAEGLQATGGYIAALRRRRTEANGLQTPDLEIIERALSQWARARHASHELRSLLGHRAPPSDTRP